MSDEDERVTMKPMLGALVQEAVRLALIDSVLVDELDKHPVEKWGVVGDRLRAEWADDIYKIPSEHIARMDPQALAQNVAVRLLGPGGWNVGGVYGGNASASELVEATFARPDHSHTDDVAFDVLRALGDDQ
jgi:hypothetical protein